MKKLVDVLFAVLSCAGLVASIFIYTNDQHARGPAIAFLARFDVQQRRPDVAKTVGFAPAADWAADIVADSALGDAYSPIDLSNTTPGTRQLWIDAITHLGDELHVTRDLLLEAIRRRPGWPFHQSLLGQVVFTADFRESSPELTQRSSMWSRPLLNAAEAGPAATAVWQALAAAYLHTWPQIGDVHSPTAGLVFRNAFSDPDFVSLMFPSTAEVIGAQRAVSYIPESPRPLRVAFDYFAARNDVRAAGHLRDRWEHAERQERARDLSVIEWHSVRGDVEEARNLCRQFVSKHPVWDFDDAVAHQQALRILELWRGGPGGRWINDPMADVVRYLSSRNGDFAPDPVVILRAVESFSDVPATTMAEVKLAAGDVSGAEQIARSADDSGSLAWSGYLLQLAHYYLRQKNINEAGVTLDRLPEAAGNTHEALLLKADIASHAPESATGTDATTTYESCESESEFRLAGARRSETAHIRFASSQPALVDIGLNGARAATVLIDAQRGVSFRLIGYGEQTVWYKRLAGGGSLCADIPTTR